MAAPLVQSAPIPPHESKASSPLKENSDWFVDTQSFLMDGSTVEFHPLISYLFRKAERAADADPNLFLRNSDSKSYGMAFKQALEHGKHGTELELPRHLEPDIDSKFREAFRFV